MAEQIIKNDSQSFTKFKKIKIFWKDYTFKLCQELSKNAEYDGIHEPNLSKIRISDRQDNSSIANILIHEILHAGTLQINDSLNREEIIETFTAVISTVIKDNKELFKMIINEI